MASVALPDGVAVQARALGGARQRQQPTFGVYLCGRRSRRRVARGWTGTWRAIWLDWPPLGLPVDSSAAVAALVEAHVRAARGEPVEIACTSGRSRTGTALAALAVRAGLDATRRWPGCARPIRRPGSSPAASAAGWGSGRPSCVEGYPSEAPRLQQPAEATQPARVGELGRLPGPGQRRAGSRPGWCATARTAGHHGVRRAR